MNKIKRYMLDTNSFDHLAEDWDSVKNVFESVQDKVELLTTYVQKYEICNIPQAKSEKREQLLDLFKEVDFQEVPVPAVVGVSVVGKCVVVGANDAYNKLLKTTASNVQDSLIGSAANREGSYVVTDDKGFIKKLKVNRINYITYGNFISEIKSLAEIIKR